MGSQMIDRGDYVRINGRPLTWEVVTLGNGGATLKSGLTGRHRFEAIERLTLVRKGPL